jgi:hypothetical protein
MGQANPYQLGADRAYKYRGDPDWVPGDPRYRDGGDLAAKAAANAGGAVGAVARRKRLLEFTAILATLGEPDPVKAPNTAVIEAGRRIGIGDKTAKGYRTALKKQRLTEEAVPATAEDAEPAEIAAALRKRIASFSPRHAALVAEYEQLRRRPGYQPGQEAAS